MIKKVSILLIVLIAQLTYSQKSQKVGYIDRDYVLENIPEYATAQSKLDGRVKSWNGKLDKFKNEIETMKLSLSNEKALLTSDLVAEREEDITIKQTELKRLQEAYFGISGDLFMLRKQLVKPIQDQIFNAIQEISKAKKYDIIFDKSSNDIVMLYSNPKYDVSELVLRKIVKGRKKKASEEKKTEKEIARENKKEKMKQKVNERLTKKEQLRERVRLQNEARTVKREALKKANLKKREERLAEVKAAREAKKNQGKKIINKEDGSIEVDKKKEREGLRIAKQQEMKRLREEKAAKREALKKVKKEEREKRIAELKAQREAKKNKIKKEEKNITEVKEEENKEEKVQIPAEVKKQIDKVVEIVEKPVKEKTKAEIRAEKMKVINANAQEKREKRDSLRKVAKEKRAKKMAEIEVRKKKLEENENN